MKCPLCQKKTNINYKPFCSKRCADIDLNRWFTQSYTVQSTEKSFIDEENEEE